VVKHRCHHLIVEDTDVVNGVDVRIRACILCGVSYDREEFLVKLREHIRAQHRLPSCPWNPGCEDDVD